MSALRCLVTTVESDAHIWNLVYLQKVLEEFGAQVRNLGCCTPIDTVVREVSQYRPDLLVVSSVNGHGHHGARLLLAALQGAGLDVPCVIGGQLTTSEADNQSVRRDLLSRGYIEVFTGDQAIETFREFLFFGMSDPFHAWTPCAPALSTTTAEGVLSCTS